MKRKIERKKKAACRLPCKWVAGFLLASLLLALVNCAGQPPEVRARGEMAVGFGVGGK